MDKSVNAFIDTDKNAEISNILDLTFDDRADRELLADQIPGIGFNLFETEGDSPTAGIDSKDN
jgi:hypothetical protein